MRGGGGGGYLTDATKGKDAAAGTGPQNPGHTIILMGSGGNDVYILNPDSYVCILDFRPRNAFELEDSIMVTGRHDGPGGWQDGDLKVVHNPAGYFGTYHFRIVLDDGNGSPKVLAEVNYVPVEDGTDNPDPTPEQMIKDIEARIEKLGVYLNGTLDGDTLTGTGGVDELWGWDGDDTLHGARATTGSTAAPATTPFAATRVTTCSKAARATMSSTAAAVRTACSATAARTTCWAARTSTSCTAARGVGNFLFRSGDGVDTILDFEDGTDKIVIKAATDDAPNTKFLSFADLTITDSAEAGGAVITSDKYEGEIIVKGVNAIQLTADDFDFVTVEDYNNLLINA